MLLVNQLLYVLFCTLIYYYMYFDLNFTLYCMYFIYNLIWRLEYWRKLGTVQDSLAYYGKQLKSSNVATPVPYALQVLYVCYYCYSMYLMYIKSVLRKATKHICMSTVANQYLLFQQLDMKTVSMCQQFITSTINFKKNVISCQHVIKSMSHYVPHFIVLRYTVLRYYDSVSTYS